MFCSFCGANIADGSAFCSVCGKQLTQVPSQVTYQQSYDEQKNALRKSEIGTLQSLIDHFSQAADEYEAYDDCSELVNYYSRGAKSALIVWGAIIASFGFLVCLAGPNALLGGLLVFFLPGALMIFGGILMKINNRRKYEKYLELYDKLANALVEHYLDYPDCPIGPEYSNPLVLNHLMSILQSGRADTIKESINIMVNDARLDDIDDYLAEIQQNTIEANANSRAAMVFLAADFFLNN